MDQKYDVYKAAGILTKDRKLLVVRGRGKDFFKSPGGKLDPGETSVQALIRELKEESKIDVIASDLEEFGTFYAPVAGNDASILKMEVLLVKKWQGEIGLNPDDQIVEFKWVNSTSAKEIKIASIFEHEVIPRLVKIGLID